MADDNVLFTNSTRLFETVKRFMDRHLKEQLSEPN
jgi:hypothetical protein